MLGTNGLQAGRDLEALVRAAGLYDGPGNPSEDVGAAWEVVCRLGERRWTAILVATPEGEVICELRRTDGPAGDVTSVLRPKGIAPTMPLAVCRAAIAAMNLREGRLADYEQFLAALGLSPRPARGPSAA